jgi:hypothetical protein
MTVLFPLLLLLIVAAYSLQQQTITKKDQLSFQDNRRIVLTSIFGVASSLLSPKPSQASVEGIEEKVVLKGIVALSPGTELAQSSGSALYLTARPDQADNIPAAILNGSRGKSPPILASKIENPIFPLEFQLGCPRDLTIEGASNTSAERSLDFTQLWWAKENLIVSARWDSDGVAATRSPDDLVGRSNWKYGQDIVEVRLEGRGAFGKFATGGSKK